MDIKAHIEAYLDAIVRDIQDLVAIRSVEDTPQDGMPFGAGCAAALNAALAKGEALGFRSKNLDNYAGYLEIGAGEELIGILTHVDVVPEGDVSHWSHPPYGHTFTDGRIYGRGSVDNKGPTILSMYAMKILEDMGVPLNKRIRHIIGANEESGFRCMEHYNQVEEPITMGFSPDSRFPAVFAEYGAYGAEVTAPVNGGDAIVIAEIHGGHAHNTVADNCIVTLRGDAARLDAAAAEFCRFAQAHDMPQEVRRTAETERVLTLHGVGAHASVPWNGVNAIAYMMEFLADITPNSPFVRGYNELIGKDCYGAKCGIQCADAYGPLSLCNGTLTFNGETAQATANLDIRFPVTVDFDRDYAPVLIRNFEQAGFTTAYTGTDRAVFVDPKSDFIQALHSAYVEVTGDTVHQPQKIGAGTYAKTFDNCVAFGVLFPGDKEMAHLTDECISVEQIRKATEIFVRALLKLLAL